MVTDTISWDSWGHYTWTVPQGVSSIDVTLEGAAGGSNSDVSGGVGGLVKATVPVSGGDTIEVYVGGGGDNPTYDNDYDHWGGWNGGGDGGQYETYGVGGGGGGATDIRINGTSLSDRVLVAAGGGGIATDNYSVELAGGDGGGDTGDDGEYASYNNLFAGEGGTQSAGGKGGDNGGEAGSLGAGGDGDSDSYDPNKLGAGGGGGGYYGGGGGGAKTNKEIGAGGGGSNYVAGIATSTRNNQGGAQPDPSVSSVDGSASITYEVPPPGTPQDVSQTVVGDGTIDVSWSAGSGGVADHYELAKSEDGGSWSLVDGNVAGTSTAVSVSPGVDTFRWRVRAVNDSGSSSWGYSATVSTDIDGLSVTSVGAGSVSVSWSDDAPQKDGAAVYIAESSGSSTGDYSLDQTTSASATSATITGLVNGRTYYVRVAAQYDGGTNSPLSNEVSATTDLPAPTLESLDASTPREITLSIAKNDNNPEGVLEIWRATQSGVRSNGVHFTDVDDTTTSYTDTGRLDGVTYHYMITRNTNDAYTDSGELSATTILPAPTNLSYAAVDEDGADLSWTNNANNGSYRVDIRHNGGSWTTVASGIPRSDEAYSLSGLLHGEEYDARVLIETSDAGPVEDV
ncbi:glycine-rich protein [Halocalculus aciditolerans]|uniref:receptor protein-tyrosine kinase n=1 Tax=Halocalculus aciditolerans TaxID=1383812 RepID=A0A830FA77_9EURY|nr:fibronectin type III domain-containing protein [Halocalculus aciditolerans]GGL55194.1 hypothetical protein GCM10009039_11640 [Halocalculus aciditolerans]